MFLSNGTLQVDLVCPSLVQLSDDRINVRVAEPGVS